MDGTPHDCTSKRKSYNDKRTIRCTYCNQQIIFDDNRKSNSGKKVPLNPNGSNHNCSKSPFNLSKNHVLDNKQDDTLKHSTDDNSAYQRLV
jgi:DNA-directed RNA polymerase subunit RPC12/RpoP